MAQQDIQISVPIIGVGSSPVAYADQILDEGTNMTLDEVAKKSVAYGPYASVAAAHTALSDVGLNTVGTTVGISGSNNTVVEYWYQGGTAQANLVKKELGSNERDAVSFDGFIPLEPVTIIEGSASEPDAILYSRNVNRFVAKKGNKYYDNWEERGLYNNGNEPYTSKIYPYNGKSYTWNGTTFEAVGEEAVRYDAQILTAQQKEQAAQNIGLDVVVKGDAQQSLSDAQKVQAQNNMMGKAYAPTQFSGLGKKVLAKNVIKVSGVDKNVMTQAFFNATNTVYVIQYDYTLGENITIPAGCTLQFDGGSISSGGTDKDTITGTGTLINAGLGRIFNDDIILNGAWNMDSIYPEWFGAKGDYDYTTGTGTDDSAAITKAIKIANLTLVNKVYLSSAYYIDGTINIESGDILIEGSYVTIREDLKFTSVQNDISYYKKSILVAGSNCTTVISANENVTHPLWFRNIGIFNYNIYNRTFNVVGIKFSSSFDGPTWPFVCEYCHFYGLDKAISFTNSQLRYLVEFVKIRNCAFNYNTWCVFFDEFSEGYNFTWSFEFTDNYCHGNVFILNIGISTGTATITGNNVEGDRATLPNGNQIPSAYSDYSKITIRYRWYSKLVFKSNHFEQDAKNAMCIIGEELSKIEIDSEFNTFNPTNQQYYSIIAESTYTNEVSAPQIVIKNIDFPAFRIKNLVQISVDTLSDIFYVEQGAYARILFNKVTPKTKYALDFTEWKNTLPTTNAYYMIDGELYSEHLSSNVYIMNPYTIETPENNNYVVVFAKAIGNEVAKFASLYVTGVEQVGLYNSSYKYVAAIRNCPSTESKTFKFYGFSTSADLLIRNMGAIVHKSATAIPIARLLTNIDAGVSIPSSVLGKIVSKKVGDNLFLSDIKKSAYYGGNGNWYDGAGNQITV